MAKRILRCIPDERNGFTVLDHQAAKNKHLSPTAKGVLWEMRRFAGLQTRFDDLTLVVIKAL